MKLINYKNILDLDINYKNKLRDWRNQDFVREKMFFSDIISEEDHKNFLRNLSIRNDKRVYVCSYDNNPVGVVSLDIFHENTSLEFGYYLIDKKFVNGGLGVILEYSVLNYGFNKLKVKYIFCRSKVSNKKVINLHSKFGFRGLNKVIKTQDKIFNIYYQQINKEMWENKKNKIEGIINFILPLDKIGEI
ncbi:GNAT family N-acetyltransferase [Clostridium sp. Mt-5]|uniref:GNAT family N-acetyltransferase n=1 Tax=Clostridium moutaii TaxID=3240932 RepID=A0ABV4BPV1_9CLOT